MGLIQIVKWAGVLRPPPERQPPSLSRAAPTDGFQLRARAVPDPVAIKAKKMGLEPLRWAARGPIKQHDVRANL